MNLVVFALRRPVTLVMVIVALVSGGILALSRMRIDIFPPLNQPQIYVVNNFAGMAPSQIEGLMTSVYEQNFQYVDGIKSIESKNIQNLALVKLKFFPGTDMAAAMSQVVSLAARARGAMPPSVLPPFVMRFDAANVPIGYLVLDSKTRPLGEMMDLGMYRIRPLLTRQVPGTVSFSPFGSNTRAIVITVHPDRLSAYNLSPDDVVRALDTGNMPVPAGNLYVRRKMPLVPTNAMVGDPQALGSIPIHPGKNVYIRDVATIHDSTDINYGCALVNGRKSVYIPVVKKDTASTLAVVNQIKEGISAFQSAVPEDVKVRYEFDESPTVRAAIRSVATEAAIGAALTGVMILIFLRDLRTVIVVLTTIPTALAAALAGLWLTGNTINIMSLGGLALSIGILVDMSVVTVENTHVQLHEGISVARAARRSDSTTASSRLLAMLCVLAVFIPTFLMKEPIRSLFMPLTLAVGFAMIASYLLSSTLIPVLSVWLMKPKHTPAAEAEGFFVRVLHGFVGAVSIMVRWRWLVVPGYVIACGLALWLVGRQVGTELFPQVDAGQFVLRFRTPPGSDYELTRQCAVKILDVIDEETGGQVAISMGYVGLAATNTATNNMLLFMRGTDDGQIRLRLRPRSGIRLDALRERLRKVLQRLAPYVTDILEKEGWARDEAQADARRLEFGFEPGDIVSEVMSFGSPMPIEVLVAGPKLGDVVAHADKVLKELQQVPALRDVQLYELLDYPTVRVDIDRERAGLSGVTVKNVTDAILVGTSSSRYLVKNYWLDQTNGIDYQVQVEVPAQQMNRPQQVENLPLRMVNPDSNLLLRDVATVEPGTAPEEIDRSSMQRHLSIIANVEGEDLGRASGQIRLAIAAAGQPPRGVRVDLLGQVAPMTEMFRTLAVGLTAAVVVILVLLTGYFQSLRLALVSLGAVPGVVCGVAIVLVATGTTLNIESFMGAIMCVGVSVSNSVLLSTFMDDHWRASAQASKAAVEGARDRLRPILMTAIAMVVGTLPMASALEEGSEMSAPLGRAVIGGLIVSTFATLLIVPALFALVLGGRKKTAASLDPDDPRSRNFDGGEQCLAAVHGGPRPDESAPTGNHPNPPVEKQSPQAQQPRHESCPEPPAVPEDPPPTDPPPA